MNNLYLVSPVGIGGRYLTIAVSGDDAAYIVRNHLHLGTSVKIGTYAIPHGTHVVGAVYVSPH